MEQRTPQVSQGTAIIQLAVNSIQNDDMDSLADYIQRMPLERLEESQSTSLLVRFLTSAVEFQRTSSVPIILEAWSSFYPSIEEVSFYTLMYTMPGIPTDILTFVSYSLEDSSFLEVIDELTILPAREELIVACQRAHSVFGPQTRDTYLVAFESAESRGNEAVTRFLLPLLLPTEEYAPVPEWVKNFRSGPVPNEKDVVPVTPKQPAPVNVMDISIDEMVDLLTDGLSTAGLSVDDVEESKNVIRSYLQIAPVEERMALLQPVLEKEFLSSLQEDDDIFRVLGPANPLFGSEVEQMSFGGCRMFTCNVFDYDDDENEYFDWFTGNCEICRKKIRNRYHAVRIPKPMGGWVGCFCSFNHVRDGLGNDELDTARPDIASRTMIDIVEREIKRIGIQDRVVPDIKEEIL